MFRIFAIFFLLATCCYTLEDGDISVLWQQYQTTFASIINEEPQNIMLLGFEGAPYNYNLDVPTPVDINLFNLVDVQPWNHNGAEKFSTAYQTMFSEVDITAGDVDRQPDIDKLFDRNKQLLLQQSQILNDTFEAYTAECASLSLFGLPCADALTYITSSGGQAEYDVVQLEIDANNMEAKTLAPLAQGPLVQAASDADGTVGVTFVQDFVQNTQKQVLNFFVSPTSQQLIDNFDQVQQAGFTVSIDHKTTHYSFTEDKYSAKVSVPFCFFSGEASASFDTTKISEDDTEFKMSINIQKWARVSVTPDDWYHGEAITIIAEQPQIIEPGFSAFDTSNGNAAFFGPDGFVNSRVTHLIVAQGIDVTISWSESTYNEIKKHIDGSTGIGIGPFRIGGSFSHDSDKIDTDDTSKSVHGTISSDIPIIIGYQTTRFNDDLIDKEDAEFVDLASADGTTTASSNVAYILVIVILCVVVFALAAKVFLQRRKLRGEKYEHLNPGISYTQMTVASDV